MPSLSQRFSGQVVLVTGAAAGIGKACAERFAAEGAKVALADINQQRGEETTEAIQERGQEAIFIPCNVGEKAQVDQAITQCVNAFGRLDCAVANAGIVRAGEFLELSEQDFDDVININIKGVFLTCQAAAKQMVAQGGGGSLICMSSLNAVLAIPTILPYIVSKGGVGQMTKAMALALAPHSIRVNAIGPGSINTEVFQTVASDPEALKRVLSRTPIGRVGETSEIASVAAFLASDDASYITGETIFVDGGRQGLNYTVPVPE